MFDQRLVIAVDAMETPLAGPRFVRSAWGFLTPFSTSGLATALLPPGMTSSNNDPRVIFGSYA